MMAVTSEDAKLYRVGGGSAIFFVDFRPTCVSVSVQSQHGDFSGSWYICEGACPREFLIAANFATTMARLAGKSFMVEAPELYEDYIKSQIQKCLDDEEINEDEAKEALEDLLNTEFSEGELYRYEILNKECFEKIFGEDEYFSIQKKVNPHCIQFWEKYWTPFVEFLKGEIEG